MAAEEAHARRIATEAGLRRLVAGASRGDVDHAVTRHLHRTHETRARRWATHDRAHQEMMANDHGTFATAQNAV